MLAQQVSLAMDDEALNNLCSIHQEMSEAHGVMAAFYEKDDGGEMAAALETDDLEKMFSGEAAATVYAPEKKAAPDFDVGKMFNA